MHLTSPTSKQVWPNSAACWSPAIPEIGRSRPRKWPGFGPGDLAVVGHHLGQRLDRHPEQVAHLRRPGPRVDVIEKRAGGVRRVGHVAGAAGQPGHQIAVDRSDGQVLRRPGLRVVLGQPGQLGAGEVGVEPQAGEFGHTRFVTFLTKTGADVRGPPVLPNNGIAGGVQSGGVPQHGRLALVGQADAPDSGACPGQSGAAGCQRRAPDVVGRVFDPAGLGNRCSNSWYPRESMWPSSPTTSAVTPVVPASIAKTATAPHFLV